MERREHGEPQHAMAKKQAASVCEEKIIPELDIAAAGFVEPEIVGLIARAVVSQFEEERLLSFHFREQPLLPCFSPSSSSSSSSAGAA